MELYVNAVLRSDAEDLKYDKYSCQGSHLSSKLAPIPSLLYIDGTTEIYLSGISFAVRLYAVSEALGAPHAHASEAMATYWVIRVVDQATRIERLERLL